MVGIYPAPMTVSLDHLNEQELLVLRLLAEGCSNAEIARRSDVSIKTVERWIELLYRRLFIDKDATRNARIEAAKYYYAANGVPPLSRP